MKAPADKVMGIARALRLASAARVLAHRIKPRQARGDASGRPPGLRKGKHSHPRYFARKLDPLCVADARAETLSRKLDPVVGRRGTRGVSRKVAA